VSDSDAAAQVIYPFGTDITVDPAGLSAVLNKQYIRGYSEALRARSNGSGLRLSSSIATYAANGSQDQDSALGYGIDRATVITDILLDGDVVFFQTRNSAKYEIYINGSLLTAAAGTGAALNADSRSYSITAGADGYLKLKFGAVGARRITLISGDLNNYAVRKINTRQVSTVTPYVPAPLHWAHFGDSFSQHTGATYQSLSLANWLHAAFGFNFDFINAGQGGTGYAASSQNFPGVAPVNGKKPSLRQQYLLNIKQCRVDLVTILAGINDGAANTSLITSEVVAMLKDIRADFPLAPILVFGTNAGSGGSTTPEATIAAACAQVSGVWFFPIQTWSAGKFLRGTGRVGATAGNGNADLYVSSDGTHPSDAGHRAWGQMIARRIYEWARAAI
jgi:lysophospholipase L1-like esterase